MAPPLDDPDYNPTEGTEAQLLRLLPDIPDPQSWWLLLRMCAEPRANHLLRAVPPHRIRDYAQAHDAGLIGNLNQLLNISADCDSSQLRQARVIAQTPGRYAGLGLRSAVRTSHAAYWAGWASALPVLSKRAPFRPFVERWVEALSSGPVERLPLPLKAAADAALVLDREGFSTPAPSNPEKVLRPSWRDLLDGVQPPKAENPEPGEWAHGWQFYAADVLEQAAFSVLLENASVANRAELRSQGGQGASAWLTAIPTCAILTMQPSLFQVAVRRRLLLPLPIGPSHCRCKNAIDPYGYHIISCRINGGPQRRAGVMEAAWRQVLSEAGAHVNNASTKPLLRNLNIPGIQPSDGRQLHILATGIGSMPLCADVTLRSPLSALGFPHGHAAAVDGSTFKQAYSDKRRKYNELNPSDPRSISCRFLTLAVETGGRFCTNCTTLFSELVKYNARFPSSVAAFHATDVYPALVGHPFCRSANSCR